MERRKVLVGVASVILSIFGVAVGITVIVVPQWGKFSNTHYKAVHRGHFGPWEICVEQDNEKVDCGKQYTQFRPTEWTFASGIVATLGLAFCVLTLLLSPLPVIMLRAKERVCLEFKTAIITKLTFSALATLSAIIAIALYSREPSENAYSYKVWRGMCFYLEMTLLIAVFSVAILSIQEWLWGRSLGGDPTIYSRDPEGHLVDIRANPAFRDAAKSNGQIPIAMTVNSALPYTIPNGHLSPGRSNLKKQKREPVTISNPGFISTENSPKPKRKVRIQTQSTDV